MKVLFENIIENATTISATNSSSNYPVINIIHPFLRLRFQSTTVNSLITVLFSTDQEIDSFWYGYYNMTSLNVVFKDSSEAILFTINKTTSENKQVDNDFFDKLTAVRKIEISISGPLGVLLGGIGAGVSYTVPDFKSEYIKGNDDSTSDIESPGGQTLQNYIEPKRLYSINFQGINEDQVKSLDAEYAKTGKGKPLFIDLLEDNHGRIEPMYGKIITNLNYNRGLISYNFPLSLKECR